MSADSSTPILVVDEHASAVTFILDALHLLGYEDIEIAANGTAGLELLRTTGPRFVLAELCMSSGSGLDMLRAIRSDQKIGECPFVMTAGSVRAHEAVVIKHAGADGLLLKPFTTAALASKIDAAVSARSLERTSRSQLKISSSLLALGRRSERRWTK